MKTIKIEDIPPDAKAREFLAALFPSREDVILEQGGQARLALVDARVLEQRGVAKEQLFTLIDGLRRRNEEVDSDAVLEELEEFDKQEGAGR